MTIKQLIEIIEELEQKNILLLNIADMLCEIMLESLIRQTHYIDSTSADWEYVALQKEKVGELKQQIKNYQKPDIKIILTDLKETIKEITK